DATHSVDKVDSAEVDVFSLKFNTQDPRMSKSLSMVYGETPQAVLGARDDGVAFAFGPSSAARGQMSKMLAAKADAFAEQPRVAAALKQISPQPQLVMLVDLLECVRMGIKIAQKAVGELPAIKLPEDPMPLVAAGLFLEPESIRGELM